MTINKKSAWLYRIEESRSHQINIARDNFFITPNDFEAEIAAVIDASKPIVAVIGPWDKDRLKAPRKGNIRMSFLVSDGLYFGEGPMGQMQREQMAAPLIEAAVALLQKLVKKTTESEQKH